LATITFQGKPLHTSGELPAVGEKAPDFTLVNGKLADVTLATYAGQKESAEYRTEPGYADLRHISA